MIKKIGWLGCILIGLSYSTVSFATIPIQEVQLTEKNKAWLVSDQTVPMLAFEMTFPQGSVFDPTGKEGLAQLTSATMDEGAGDYESSAFQKKLEDLHIELHFSASRDSFSVNVTCLKKVCSEAFNLLTLALTKPRFDSEPIARMKQALLTNLDAEQTDPNALAGNSFNALVYGKYPYARSSRGTKEGIQSIEKKDLESFVKNLSTENLIISASGDIEREDFKKLITPLLKNLPDHSSPTPSLQKAVFENKDQLKVIPLSTPQTTFIYGLKGITRQDPDFIASYIMNHILGGGGFSSRLTQTIREKHGLSYGIDTSLEYGRYGEMWIGQMATRNDKAKQALSLLKEEIDRIINSPLSEEELNNAKQYLLGSYALRLDSNGKLVNWLTGLQRDQLPIDYFDKRVSLLKAVTVQDIQRVAKRLLDPKKLTVIAVGQPEL
jgi:zinc protease